MARPASTPLRDFCLPKDQSVPLAGHPAARLGTFINMNQDAESVNRYLRQKRVFPQNISIVFRSSYGLNLCIARG
jgi:hypothetical protein